MATRNHGRKPAPAGAAAHPAPASLRSFTVAHEMCYDGITRPAQPSAQAPPDPQWRPPANRHVEPAGKSQAKVRDPHMGKRVLAPKQVHNTGRINGLVVFENRPLPHCMTTVLALCDLIRTT
jgi:hypothetical protein